jgi:hypothetical protein
MCWWFSTIDTKCLYTLFRIWNICTSSTFRQYHLCESFFVQNCVFPHLLTSPPSVDESGDYIAWSQHPTSGTIHQATYCTLFDIRRAYDPHDIELIKPTIPSQPQPVSIGPASLLGTWFAFNQSLTGDQVDALRKPLLTRPVFNHLVKQNGDSWRP